MTLSGGWLKQINEQKHITDKENYELGVRHGKELLFVSVVDNFQCYLTEVLSLIFHKIPEALSDKSTKNSIIFQFTDIVELKKHIVDMAVLGFGYKSIDDLDQYFVNNLKMKLFESWMEKRRLNRLIQIRNIIAHNRGVINQQFMGKCGAKFDKIGDKVIIPNVSLVDRYVINLAQKFDRRLVQKFKIESYYFKNDL